MTLYHTLESARSIRDQLLLQTDWLVSRHIEQLKLVSSLELFETVLSNEQYIELLKYRQDLRDSINSEIEPESITKPTFLGD